MDGVLVHFQSTLGPVNKLGFMLFAFVDPQTVSCPVETSIKNVL